MKSKLAKSLLMLAGVLMVGLAVGLMRLAGFGVDPYSCLNLGISGLLGLSFGTWQMLLNALLLGVMLLFHRELIGPGTLVNMVCVGYIGDFVVWLGQGLPEWPALRVLFLALGTLSLSLGSALYMTTALGISPYDAVSVMLSRRTGLSFRLVRVSTDLLFVVLGCLATHFSGASLFSVLGVGTVVSAFGVGPLIQMFQRRVTDPLLQRLTPAA